MSTQIFDTTLSNGVNLQPSYYNGGAVNFGWGLMKQFTNIKTVRIEIEPDKINEAAEWISVQTGARCVCHEKQERKRLFLVTQRGHAPAFNFRQS